MSQLVYRPRKPLLGSESALCGAHAFLAIAAMLFSNGIQLTTLVKSEAPAGSSGFCKLVRVENPWLRANGRMPLPKCVSRSSHVRHHGTTHAADRQLQIQDRLRPALRRSCSKVYLPPFSFPLSLYNPNITLKGFSTHMRLANPKAPSRIGAFIDPSKPKQRFLHVNANETLNPGP